MIMIRAPRDAIGCLIWNPAAFGIRHVIRVLQCDVYSVIQHILSFFIIHQKYKQGLIHTLETRREL